MSARDAITPAVLRELLTYDPDTGALTWKARDVSWFNATERRSAANTCAVWNARYAGTPALAANDGQGYLAGSVLGVAIKAHRAAWAIIYGKWPDEVDHQDGDTMNNRKMNLVDGARAGNSKNRKPYRKNSDLPPGVRFDNRKRRPYGATIKVDGRTRYIGYYGTPDEAHAAYLAAAREHGFSPRHGRI